MAKGHEHALEQPIQQDTSSLHANGVRTSPPVRRTTVADESRRAHAPSLKDHAVTAALALVFGAIGAYAFEHFNKKEPAPAVADSRGGGSPVAGPSTRDLNDQIVKLSDRVDAVNRRLKAMPDPQPPLDLTDLRVRVAECSQITDEIPPLRGEIQRLDGRISEMSKTITLTGGDLRAIPKRGGALRTTSVSNRAAVDGGRDGSEDVDEADDERDRPETTEPRVALKPVPAELASTEDLRHGVILFNQQKFKEASDLFNKLEQTNPDDARVWYYAALAHGFATDQWTSEGAGRLVEKGIEREQAGTPPRSIIDDTFKGLTSATGKDWLASYRDRVNKR